MFATSAAPTSFGQHFYTSHAHVQSRPPAHHPSVFASAGYQTRKRTCSQKEEDDDDDGEKRNEQGFRFKRPRKGDFERASPLTNTHFHTVSPYDNSFQQAQTSSSSFEPLATNYSLTGRPRIVDLSSGEVLETLTPVDISSSPGTSGNDYGFPSDTDPTVLSHTYNLAKRVRDRFDEFGCIADIWRRDDCAGMQFGGSMAYDQTRCAKRQRIEPPTEEMGIVKAVPSGGWTPCDVFRGTFEYTCELANGVTPAFCPPFEGNGSAETCQDLVLYCAPSNQIEEETGDARLIELGNQEEDKKEPSNEDAMDLD